MNGELTSTQTTPLQALLVGIDRYKTQQDLGGCLSYVEAMRTLLKQRYDVSDGHIRILTNENATRTNTLDKFRQCLIDEPDIRPPIRSISTAP